MSTATAGPRVPDLTLGWRLKMALGEHKAEWIADQLGVGRQTVSRWMSDRGAAPRRAYLMQWALLTGVDVDWLTTGRAQTRPPDGGGERRARRDSNPQPSDPNVRGRAILTLTAA